MLDGEAEEEEEGATVLEEGEEPGRRDWEQAL
jgi:hypothetical protein